MAGRSLQERHTVHVFFKVKPSFRNRIAVFCVLPSTPLIQAIGRGSLTGKEPPRRYLETCVDAETMFGEGWVL